MALVFIGLGSNLGDGRSNLLLAWQLLGEQKGINTLVLSSPYLSRPVVKESWLRAGRQLSEQWFTNAVGVLETDLAPLDLLTVLQAIEAGQGRDREKSLDRRVDLDILYYDDLLYLDEVLELPHPEIKNRLFVLAPLEELAPDHRHPRTGQTTRQMRCSLPDGSDNDICRQAWLDGTNRQGAVEA